MINKVLSFSLVAIVCFLPSKYVFADPDPEIVPPKHIVVTGRVGGIVPGPIEPAPAAPSDDDEDTDEEEKEKASELRFTLSVGAGEEIYGGEQMAVFRQITPAFFGTASVQNAIVSLQFRKENFVYSVSTRVNEQKEWSWTASTPFPDGVYTVSARLFHPFTFKELTRQDIQFAQVNSEPIGTSLPVFPVETGQQIADIIVSPVPGYEHVKPGEVVKARIHLLGFGQHRDIVLEYIMVGPDGQVHLQQQETLESRTSESFVKPFFTKEDLVPGKYILLVRAVAGNQVSFGSTTFQLEELQERKSALEDEAPKATNIIGVVIAWVSKAVTFIAKLVSVLWR